MATTVARLEAVLSAQTRDFDRAMDRSHGKMGKLGKAAGVAGLAIATGLGIVAKVGWNELKEAQKVTAQTNAVLKSTGGLANVTAKHIDKLATAISNYSGMDDEAVQAGENMLLTFRDIRNRVGENNDIFDQATQATADLSTAMGMDMTKAALQLGKALNDPARGMSRLQRIGVTFTDQQKDLVKHLMATGQTAAAQKVILHELTLEFGGSAEAAGKTLGGQLKITQERFSDLAGEIVKAALPAFLAFTGAVIPIVIWLTKHEKIAKILFVALGALATALIAASVAQRLMNLAALANPYVAVAAALIALTVVTIKYRNQIMATFNWIKENWVLLVSILAGPIGLATSQIITHFSGIRSAAVGTFNRIVDVAQAILKPFGKAVSAIIEAVTAMKDAFGFLADKIGAVVGWLKWIINNVKKITGVFGIIGHGVGAVAGGIGDFSGRELPGPTTGASAEGKAFHVGTQLWDEIRMGNMLGLHTTSGYRPGAVTIHGTKSDHSYDPSRAVDMAGSSFGMASLFRALIGRKEVRQAFYDPLGSIFNGAFSSYREGGHSDHIHIAEYDKGGILKPGVTMAVNKTGKNETVLPWEAKKDSALALLKSIWSVAGSFYGQSAGKMPIPSFWTYNESGDSSPFVWSDQGRQRKPHFRSLVFNEPWVNALLGIRDKTLTRTASLEALRNWALETIIHEWTHIFQAPSIINDDKQEWIREGGAVNFTRLFAKKIYDRVGIPYTQPSSDGDIYDGFAAHVLKKFGWGWVAKTQFGAGLAKAIPKQKFDSGGWLQPGATLALNNTGRPERVGGGAGIINFNFPNYVGSKQDLISAMREAAAQFARRNNRPAFGT
jgi:hypothetical protein